MAVRLNAVNLNFEFCSIIAMNGTENIIKGIKYRKKSLSFVKIKTDMFTSFATAKNNENKSAGFMFTAIRCNSWADVAGE
jgi:hypothetical protein